MGTTRTLRPQLPADLSPEEELAEIKSRLDAIHAEASAFLSAESWSRAELIGYDVEAPRERLALHVAAVRRLLEQISAVEAMQGALAAYDVRLAELPIVHAEPLRGEIPGIAAELDMAMAVLDTVREQLPELRKELVADATAYVHEFDEELEEMVDRWNAGSGRPVVDAEALAAYTTFAEELSGFVELFPEFPQFATSVRGFAYRVSATRALVSAPDDAADG
jgi:hypothetical protein